MQQLVPYVGHCSSVTAFVSCIRVADLFNAVDPTGYWDFYMVWSGLMSDYFEWFLGYVWFQPILQCFLE